jgi:hypothetical protein
MAAPVSACIAYSLHSGVTSKHGATCYDFLTGHSVMVTECGRHCPEGLKSHP